MRLSGPVDACPYRRVGPAPEGWELANQAALEEDIRFGLMVLWPAFKVGPWEARDATAATVKRATAKKRSGGLKRIPLDLKAVRRARPGRPTC
jgi:hypothetical protein